MGPSLFQFSQNISERIIGPHYVDTPPEDLDEASNRHFIIGIDENQILDEEESDDVVAGDFENRNAGVPSLENFADRFEAQFFVYPQHERPLHGRHDLLDCDIPVCEGTRHGIGSLLINLVFLDVNFEYLHHFGACVRRR